MAGRRRTRDHFAKRAQREKYPARSIYKLEEIDRRVRIIKPGFRVLDLGACPGSWTQYCAGKVGLTGTVVAVDKNPLKIAVPPQVVELQIDVFEATADELGGHVKDGRFDVVVSDMAPRTSGQRFVDQTRSYNLFMRALAIADDVLRPGGAFVGKLFFGEDFENARTELRRRFGKVRVIKPKSVRSESYEIYLVGIEYR